MNYLNGDHILSKLGRITNPCSDGRAHQDNINGRHPDGAKM